MKILIIGGTKFLGYHLTSKLLQKKHEIFLFNRGRTPDDFGNRVTRLYGDRTNHSKFYNLLAGKNFDVVVDLIGYGLQDVRTAVKTFRDRVGQYIFISTGQVYLITRNEHLPARERDYAQELIPCPPGEEKSYYYGLKKRQIEDYLEERFTTEKFPSVRLRCPIIHGARDYTLRLYSYLLRIADGYPVIIPSEGDSIIRHIYVEDVVGVILKIMQTPDLHGKVFNLAQEQVFRLSEFINILAACWDKKTEVLKIPGHVLYQYALGPDISPFSGRWVSYMDPGLAREKLNFKSTPVQEWIPRVIEYFFGEYNGLKPENYRKRNSEIELSEKWL